MGFTIHAQYTRVHWPMENKLVGWVPERKIGFGLGKPIIRKLFHKMCVREQVGIMHTNAQWSESYGKLN